ncbi:MAG: ribosome small subunit-dependent GTPase A [Marinilabiliaceae bacterium]|jgi:ribosome biogenesis GTPase|nr:ribosome small subunit-dependent GTPase A [Marinilabiliaceae bacterium]
MKTGLVIKSTGSRYRVKEDGGGITECVIKGKFRTQGIKGTNPVAVGDRVVFEQDEGQTGIIKEISERKNYIIRKSSNLSKQYQIIASNIDQAVLLISLRMPETQVEFIDRFLVSAEAFRIPVSLIFNKTDLYNAEDKERLAHLLNVYSAIGYACYCLSLESLEGFDKVKALFKKNISLVSGNSGVGKSTLLKAIDPSLQLKVARVSDYHKQGRHTTTFAEMFLLPDGGYIIDTPGIKGFGLVEFEKEEIYHFFPEIFRISSGCRYNNCLHFDEPGCHVKEAVEKGDIEWTRYRSYLNIMFDSNSKYR